LISNPYPKGAPTKPPALGDGFVGLYLVIFFARQSLAPIDANASQYNHSDASAMRNGRNAALWAACLRGSTGECMKSALVRDLPKSLFSSSANAFVCASCAHVPMYAARRFSKNTFSTDETDFSVRLSKVGNKEQRRLFHWHDGFLPPSPQIREFETQSATYERKVYVKMQGAECKIDYKSVYLSRLITFLSYDAPNEKPSRGNVTIKTSGQNIRHLQYFRDIFRRFESSPYRDVMASL